MKDGPGKGGNAKGDNGIMDKLSDILNNLLKLDPSTK